MAENFDVTQLSKKARQSDRETLDRFLPLICDELYRVAASQLRRERDNHTLQPTTLVHEAYVRLLEQKEIYWENRLHFFDRGGDDAANSG